MISGGTINGLYYLRELISFIKLFNNCFLCFHYIIIYDVDADHSLCPSPVGEGITTAVTRTRCRSSVTSQKFDLIQCLKFSFKHDNVKSY